jgi:type I restriction enzyme S subunit
MELKPGYKQTDVGVIPEEWEVAVLVDLVDQSRSIRYGIVQPGKYDPQGRFMIRGQDYSKGWVHPSDLFKVGSVIEERYRNARVKAGDLIITIVGAGTGHVEVVPNWLDGANLTQTTARIAIDPAKADSGFCKFVLQSGFGKIQVAEYIKGAAQPGLNCGDVGKFLIPLPTSLPEQPTIAAALSDVHALIASLDKLIAKKRDLKQAARQRLLTGQTRLLGFSGEWEMKPIGSFSAFVTKGATPTTYGFNWEEDGVLFLRSECVSDDGLDLAQSMFISEAAHAALIRGEVRSGDILMTITGNVGRLVHLKPDFGIANINQHIARIRVKDPGVLSDFVYHWLSQPSVRAYYTSITTGQAYPQISLKQVRETPVPLPPFAEQTAIATVLSDMDAEIAALEQRREKTRALKQGMMQELLTGRTRLV